jgi:hypothetical protein
MTGTMARRVLQQGGGRCILRLNDVPEMRELFAWATIETVELSYQARNSHATGGAMSQIRRNISRRRLDQLLSRVDDEAFFSMCWATHAIQSGREAGVDRFYRYPTEAVGGDVRERLRIHPWMIETLLNEVLSTPKLSGTFWPPQSCRSFGAMVQFYNALFKLEGLDDRRTAPESRGLPALHRIAQRQFEWQRSFLSVPQLYRAGFLYGGPQSRAYFQAKYGFSFDDFTFTCFAIHASLMDTPCVRLSDALTQHGLPRETLQAVVELISRPHQQARIATAELRSEDGHVGYKMSALRTHPCVIFGDRIYAPLPELVSLRGSTGVFYDVVGGPEGVTNEISKQFEHYTQKLLSALLCPMRVTGEYTYPHRRQQQPTPDVVLYDNDGLAVIFECKAVRMPHPARFAELPSAADARGYRELAKGVFQIWRFASHIRRGIVSSEKPNPNLRGVVVTLDSWLSMAIEPPEQVRRMALELTSKDPDITDEDRIPVTFCLIDDLESTLSFSTPGEFLATIVAAAEERFRGWLLPHVRRELFPEPRAQAPYPFAREISEHVPWWERLASRLPIGSERA